ncbi:MAG: arylsulfatase, partial [Lutimonas sp.]
MKKNYLWLSLLVMALTLQLHSQKKPNIVVIWGDDLGVDNVSAYHRGMVKPMTPNIDRIANE